MTNQEKINAAVASIQGWSKTVDVKLTDDGKGYTVHGDKRVPDIALPRVTGILNVVEKYGLRKWAMNTALGYVKDNLTEAMQVLPFDEALALTLEGAAQAPEQTRDDAADFGTEAHALLQALFDEPNTVVPDPFRTVVHSWMKWLEDSNLRVAATEQSLYYYDDSPSGKPIAFAGTADVIAIDQEGIPVICDYKTGKHIYSEYALQMGAYSMALGYCGVGSFLTAEQIAKTRAVVIRLPKEEGQEIEVREVDNVEFQEDSFLYACRLKEWQSSRKKWSPKKRSK